MTYTLDNSKIKIASKVLNLSDNEINIKLLTKLDGYLEALSDLEALGGLSDA